MYYLMFFSINNMCVRNIIYKFEVLCDFVFYELVCIVFCISLLC